MHVGILLFDGFDEMDAIGPFEVFANAGRAGADCEVGLYTLDSADRVEASHGLRVEPDGTLPGGETDPDASAPTASDTSAPTASDAPGPVDLLVVPGGGWNDRDRPGAWTAAEEGAVPDAIAAAHDRGATVATVCTGGMLAARAGVLDGRPAVTHASALDDLRQYADVVEARVVDDGEVVTAGGVTSGLDLAFHLVEREFGGSVADRVATEMEYERGGRVVTRG